MRMINCHPIERFHYSDFMVTIILNVILTENDCYFFSIYGHYNPHHLGDHAH